MNMDATAPQAKLSLASGDCFLSDLSRNSLQLRFLLLLFVEATDIGADAGTVLAPVVSLLELLLSSSTSLAIFSQSNIILNASSRPFPFLSFPSPSPSSLLSSLLSLLISRAERNKYPSKGIHLELLRETCKCCYFDVEEYKLPPVTHVPLELQPARQPASEETTNNQARDQCSLCLSVSLSLLSLLSLINA